jgi:hypothetical protein
MKRFAFKNRIPQGVKTVKITLPQKEKNEY